MEVWAVDRCFAALASGLQVLPGQDTMSRPVVDSLGPLWYAREVYSNLGLRRIRLLRIGRRYLSDRPELQSEISCLMTEMSLDDPSDQITYDAVSYA